MSIIITQFVLKIGLSVSPLGCTWNIKILRGSEIKGALAIGSCEVEVLCVVKLLKSGRRWVASNCARKFVVEARHNFGKHSVQVKLVLVRLLCFVCLSEMDISSVVVLVTRAVNRILRVLSHFRIF